MDFAIKRAPVRYRLSRGYRLASDFFDELRFSFWTRPVYHLKAWLS